MPTRFNYLRTGSHAAGLVLVLISGMPWAATAAADAIHSLRYRHVDLISLGAFEFDDEKGTLNDIPASVRALDGARVSVDGGMIPVEQCEHFRSFVLLPYAVTQKEHMETPIQTVMLVECPAGQQTAWSGDVIRVEGRLHVAVRTDEGYVTSVFSLTPDSVRVLPRLAVGRSRRNIGLGAGTCLLICPSIVRTLVRRRRGNDGLCAACGYDLRATPTRCPECGRAL